ERAARLYGAAEAIRRDQGMLLSAERRARREKRARSLCLTLGELRFAEAWAAGGAMSLEQTIAYALEDAPSSIEQPDIGRPVGPLSRGEGEVAKLLARGMTNREIARELTITEGTAGVHVVHILNKLGL